MTDPTEPKDVFESPDEVGSADSKGALDQEQAVLIREVIDDPHAHALDFSVVNDEKAGIYEAVVGETEIGGLPYNVASDDRLVLLGTSVFPEYRRQGVATRLIRHVLDDVRTQGKTVTIMCPIVRTFIERNPEYSDLIDSEHPGATSGSHRS